MQAHIPPLFVVLVVAAAAPLLAEVTRRLGISVVVLEILLGVVIGPQGLALAQPEGPLPHVAPLGMAFLFFLAGLEIDLHEIRGEPLKRSIGGWLAVFGLACVVALALREAGMIRAWTAVAIALATTALGVLVPMLRDTGLRESVFGKYVIAAGVMGELGPILAMSIVLTSTYTAGVQTAFSALFIAAVLFVSWVVVKGLRLPGVLGVLSRTMTRTGQLPVRLAIVLVGALVLLAENLGLDLALGALAAGMIIGLATRDVHGHVLHHKLDAIGFGFLVPVFFITSGMKLDVAAVVGSGSGLALTAILFVATLVVRAPLAFAHRGLLGGRERAALALFSATTLSLVVALAEIGVARGLVEPAEAAPMVGAAILTVVIFPVVALWLRGHRVAAATVGSREWDGL